MNMLIVQSTSLFSIIAYSADSLLLTMLAIKSLKRRLWFQLLLALLPLTVVAFCRHDAKTNSKRLP